MGRYRSAYYDPEGARYGVPTYPWQMAPAGLATRRQLGDKGLRPGGQPVAAQVMWHTPRRPSGAAVAYLYRLDLAKPKRTPTPAQMAALAKAMTARCRCRSCGQVAPYVLPRHWDACLGCTEEGTRTGAADYDDPIDGMRVGPADYDDPCRCWL